MNTEKLLSVSVVSKRLSCSVSSVYRLIDYYDLQAVKVGPKKGLRVSEKELQKYIESRKTDSIM